MGDGPALRGPRGDGVDGERLDGYAAAGGAVVERGKGEPGRSRRVDEGPGRAGDGDDRARAPGPLGDGEAAAAVVAGGLDAQAGEDGLEGDERGGRLGRDAAAPDGGDPGPAEEADPAQDPARERGAPGRHGQADPDDPEEGEGDPGGEGGRRRQEQDGAGGELDPDEARQRHTPHGPPGGDPADDAGQRGRCDCGGGVRGRLRGGGRPAGCRPASRRSRRERRCPSRSGLTTATVPPAAHPGVLGADAPPAPAAGGWQSTDATERRPGR